MIADERWIVTSASGQLGGHLIRQLLPDARVAIILAGPRNPLVSGATPGEPPPLRAECDLSALDQLAALVTEFRPTHIAHVGAMTAVADCFAAPKAAERANTLATAALAGAAAATGARMVFSSSDMVFAGDAAPYREK